MIFKKAIPYDIIIQPTKNNFFVVRIGCCTMAYTDKDKMVEDLQFYLTQPKEVEKAYNMKEQEDCRLGTHLDSPVACTTQ